MSGEFIGVICDGNRRAKREQLAIDALSVPQLHEAYRAGARRVQELVTRARQEAIGIIALWGLSDGNLEKRPKEELEILYGVYDEFLEELEHKWMKKSENKLARLVHMGRRDRLERVAPSVMERMDRIQYDTRLRTGIVVAPCLDYGGHDEVARAMERWVEHGHRGTWKDHLDLPRNNVPFRPVDLIIRTGEDTRLKHTNSFLWGYEGAETRHAFHPEHLPFFTNAKFDGDIEDVRTMVKRKGK